MRYALVLSFVANLVLTALSLDILPERIAIHFGAGGWADAWGDAGLHAALTTAMHVAFFLVFLYAPRWVFAVPGHWVRMPNRRFWPDPARRAQTERKLERLMWPFGTAFFLFFFVTGLLTIEAHRTEPPRLNEAAFLGTLAVLLGVTVCWLVAWSREFRVPDDPSAPHEDRG